MIYYKSARQAQDILDNDKERQRWKCHFLYLEGPRATLNKKKKKQDCIYFVHAEACSCEAYCKIKIKIKRGRATTTIDTM